MGSRPSEAKSPVFSDAGLYDDAEHCNCTEKIVTLTYGAIKDDFPSNPTSPVSLYALNNFRKYEKNSLTSRQSIDRQDLVCRSPLGRHP